MTSIDTQEKHIYQVEYTILVEDGILHSYFYEGKVRCIAQDEYYAMSLVTSWARSTDFIWHENQECEINPGIRKNITITKIQIHTPNIQDLLTQYPLPDVFQDEE